VPEWLINVLVQFPIVVVIGFVAWYAYGQIRTNNADHLRRLEVLHQAQIAALKDALAGHLASKDREIERPTG
jgi:hypothetical protein